MAITGNEFLLSPVTKFPYIMRPLNNITPFTYVDGTTYLEILTQLDTYIQGMGPDVDSKLSELFDEFQAGIGNAENTIIQETVKWQTSFDAFMANVVVELEGLNDEASANLITRPGTAMHDALTEFINEITPDSFIGTDTQKVIAATGDAVANDHVLRIDDDYVIDGNIPNFWDVNQTGVGTLTREGYTFYVSPHPDLNFIPTNNIFVNADTGSDDNDGLSPSFAHKSIAGSYRSTLRRLTPTQAQGAKWVVNLKGEFDSGTTFDRLPNFPNGLEFIGEEYLTSIPKTKIVKTTANIIGMWFEPGVRTVTVRNIAFHDFTSGFNGYAILCKGGGKINVYDCTADNCDIGFAAIRNVDFNFTRCRTTNVPTAFMAQYNSSGLFSFCEGNGAANHVFFITRNSVVHVDDCFANDSLAGVRIDMASRAAIVRTNFKRNKVAIITEGAGEWNDENSIFNEGTVNANIVNYSNNGVGRETRLYSQASKSEFLIGTAWRANPIYVNPVSLTGLSNTNIYLGTALGRLPRLFFEDYKKLRVVVSGYTTAALPFSCNVELWGNGSAGLAIIARGVIGSGTNGGFEIEFNVTAINLKAQQSTTRGISHGGATTIYRRDTTLDFTEQMTFRIMGQHSGGGVVPAFFTNAEIWALG